MYSIYPNSTPKESPVQISDTFTCQTPAFASPIARLPSEMLELIFSFLPKPSDFLSTALTCREWSAVVYGSRIDYFGHFFNLRSKLSHALEGVHFRSFFQWAPYSCLLSIFKMRPLLEEEKSQFIFQSFQKFQIGSNGYRKHMELSKIQGQRYNLHKWSCGYLGAQAFVIYSGAAQMLCYSPFPGAPPQSYALDRRFGDFVGVKQDKDKVHIVTQYEDFIYDVNKRELTRNTKFSLISQIKQELQIARETKSYLEIPKAFTYLEIVRVIYEGDYPGDPFTNMLMVVRAESLCKVTFYKFNFDFSSEKGCIENLRFLREDLVLSETTCTLKDCLQADTDLFFAYVIPSDRDFNNTVAVINKKSQEVIDVPKTDSKLLAIHPFPDNDRLFFVCKNGDILIYSCTHREIEKKSNFFEALARNVTIQSEEIEKKSSLETKKRKLESKQINLKKRKIERHQEIASAHLISESKCVLELRGFPTIWTLFDLESETVLQEFEQEEEQDILIHRKLLVNKNINREDNEGHQLSIFKFDEEVNRFIQIADLHFGSKKASEKSSFLNPLNREGVQEDLLTKVFRVTSFDNLNYGLEEGSKTFISYVGMLNESHLAIVIYKQEEDTLPYFYFSVCSLETGEMHTIYERKSTEVHSLYEGNSTDLLHWALFQSLRQTHHHIVFLLPFGEEKTLGVYNQLTGKTDHFDSNRLCPTKKTAIDSFDIVERDHEHFILVTLIDSAEIDTFEFVEICLGRSDFKIGPKKTNTDKPRKMEIDVD